MPSPELYTLSLHDLFRSAITPDFVYDEVATARKVQGADEVITVWQGWATAFPDSRATFHQEFASGNMVVLEHTWNGTHSGPDRKSTRLNSSHSQISYAVSRALHSFPTRPLPICHHARFRVR